jgi:hypothetical protein
LPSPWTTPEDARRHKKDLTDEEAEEWLRLARKYLPRMGHARAIMQASSAINRQRRKRERAQGLSGTELAPGTAGSPASGPTSASPTGSAGATGSEP